MENIVTRIIEIDREANEKLAQSKQQQQQLLADARAEAQQQQQELESGRTTGSPKWSFTTKASTGVSARN